MLVSESVSAQDGNVALGKAHTRSASQHSPQCCPRNSANVCLVEHRSFPTSDGGMSAASFLHSSFLQAVKAVMLWPVQVQTVPQASEHLCPAKLQTRCDIFYACQWIRQFIPTSLHVFLSGDQRCHDLCSSCSASPSSPSTLRLCQL